MKKTSLQALGENLRKKRKQIGLTLQEAARRANVNPGNLSRLEHGKMQPFSTGTLLRIANIYKVSPRGLLALAGKPEPLFSDVKLSIEALEGLIEETLPSTEEQQIVHLPRIQIKKRDGDYELYKRDKLLQSIEAAVDTWEKHRQLTKSDVREITFEIERKIVTMITTRNTDTISTSEIKSLVLDKLRDRDYGAFVRYLSFYLTESQQEKIVEMAAVKLDL